MHLQLLLPSYQYLRMHCNMGKLRFLSAMCFMSPISGDPFKSKYFARGPSTHKSLTFRLNTVISFWNDLSTFVLLLLLLVKARKVIFNSFHFLRLARGSQSWSVIHHFHKGAQQQCWPESFCKSGKFLRQVHYWLKNFWILCNTKYPDNNHSVQMNWKVPGRS